MSYLSTILADAPTHYWRLADTPGAIAHDIGSAPIHAAGPLVGLSYTGPAANGGSCFGSAPNFGFTARENVAGASPFSCEGWLWFTESAPTAAYAIFAWDGVTGGVGAYLQLDTARTLTAFIGASAAITTAALLTTQHWHHIVLNYDGVNAHIYIDGAVAKTQAVAAPAAWNLHFGMGIKTNATNAINFGWLSEVALYNFALSAAQVLAHFNAAEQTAQSPVFTGGGVFNLTTGSNSPGSDQTIQDILAAVKHSYLAQ